MLALRNRWYLWARNLVQAQGRALKVRFEQGWVDAEHPEARTTEQLSKDIEVVNRFSNSLVH